MGGKADTPPPMRLITRNKYHGKDILDIKQWSCLITQYSRIDI